MSGSQIDLSITRAEVAELCKRLGFDPKSVEAIEFTTLGVYVTCYAWDQEGKLMQDGREIAQHRIFVPIVDGEKP